METETLIGGDCDGLEIQKTNHGIMYAGQRGDGIVRVYKRSEDGKLHFSHKVYVSEVVITDG